MNAPSLLGTSSTVPSMVAGIMLDTLSRVAPVFMRATVFSADATASFCML